MNWILQGAIEDYQPELPNGEPNADYHALYYTRCVKLLANIERCVVYGTPRTHELQRLYEKGQITMEEYEIMEQADRRYNAAQLTSAQNELLNAGTFGGNLLYKRVVRTSRCSRKPWKTRYFQVSERMLYCYNVHPSEGGRLVRAMPLEGAVISETLNAKYKYMFEVQNFNYLFRMRAADANERARWIRILKEERESHTLYPHQISIGDSDESSHGHGQKQFMQDLTASQKARYDFFKNQRDYLRNLTEVAEDLRHQDREIRKAQAPGLVQALNTPPCVYIPLCNSTDMWKRVSSAVANETRVFNTKERCPVVMYFLLRRGEKLGNRSIPNPILDVAQYLKLQYEVPDESLISIAEEDENASFEVFDNGNDGLIIAKSEDDVKHSTHKLWSDEENHSSVHLTYKASNEDVEHGLEKHPNTTEGTRGNMNAQLKKFLKANVVRIPSKIKARLPQRSKRSLMVSGMLPLQQVPILENRAGEDDEERSVLSDVSGSMLTAEGGMVTPKEKDGIDDESLKRAYKIICNAEPWVLKSERILKESLANGVIDNNANTEVQGILVKSNDDLRQEVFVMQMIHFYKSVFAKASLPIWLRTYRILSTSKDTGIIEYLIDSTSIHGLKSSEDFPVEGGLRAYFEKIYGPPSGKSFQAAQRNFMLSLVGYSLVSYLLGLKDRHNGNIMIDVRGRLIFIDFGFAMGMAPGECVYFGICRWFVFIE